MMRLVGAERNGHGNGTRSNRERKSERVEGAAENIVGIHFFLDLWPAIDCLFALEHGPAIGNDDEAAADLHNGNGDSEEMQNVGANEERGNQQDKTVQSNLARQDAAQGTRIVSRQGEKDGAAAEGIHDGEKRAEDEQNTFGDFEQGDSSGGESIAEARL